MSTIMTPDSFTVTADNAQQHFEGVLKEFPQYDCPNTINQVLAGPDPSVLTTSQGRHIQIIPIVVALICRGVDVHGSGLRPS